ncbi:hypothetical protein UT300003_32940 [Clostridium sardiniense]
MLKVAFEDKPLMFDINSEEKILEGTNFHVYSMYYTDKEVSEYMDKFFKEFDKFMHENYYYPKYFILGKKAYEILLYGIYIKYHVVNFENMFDYPVILLEDIPEDYIKAVGESKETFGKITQ